MNKSEDVQAKHNAWRDILNARDHFKARWGFGPDYVQDAVDPAVVSANRMRAKGVKGARPWSDSAFVAAYNGGQLEAALFRDFEQTRQAVPQITAKQLEKHLARKKNETERNLVGIDRRRLEKKKGSRHFERWPRQAEWLKQKLRNKRNSTRATYVLKGATSPILLTLLQDECEQAKARGDEAFGPAPSCQKVIRRFLDAWKKEAPYEYLYIFKGKKQADQALEPVLGSHRAAAKYPGHIVEADFTPIDALFPDGKARYLGMAVDLYTGLMSFVVTDSEGSDAVAALFFRFMDQRFVPAIIRTDRGSGFRSARIGNACEDLGVVLDILPGHSPKLKGTVERRNGMVNMQVTAMTAAWKGRNVSERQAARELDGYGNMEKEEKRRASLGDTVEEFQEFAENWLAVEHNKPKGQAKKSANALLRDYAGAKPVRVLRTDEERRAIVLHFAPSGTATLRKYGFQIKNKRYGAPVLHDHAKWIGHEFELRFDPADERKLHVYDRDEETKALRFVCVAELLEGQVQHRLSILAKKWHRAHSEEERKRARQFDPGQKSITDAYRDMIARQGEAARKIVHLPGRAQSLSEAGVPALDAHKDAARAAAEAHAAETRGAAHSGLPASESSGERYRRLLREKQEGSRISPEDQRFLEKRESLMNGGINWSAVAWRADVLQLAGMHTPMHAAPVEVAPLNHAQAAIRLRKNGVEMNPQRYAALVERFPEGVPEDAIAGIAAEWAGDSVAEARTRSA